MEKGVNDYRRLKRRGVYGLASIGALTGGAAGGTITTGKFDVVLDYFLAR